MDLNLNIVDSTAEENGKLSDNTQRILRLGVDRLHHSIRTGNTPEWGADESVVLIIGDDTDLAVAYAHKDDLEQTLRSMGITEERVSARVLNRCKGPTPPKALRVLLITPEVSVSCLTGAPEELAKISSLTDAAREQIKKTLEPYPKDVQRDALLETISVFGELEELLHQYDQLVSHIQPDPKEPSHEEIKDEIKRLFLPFREAAPAMEARAKKAVFPPDRRTPSNVETMTMALAYTLEPFNMPLNRENGVGEYALQWLAASIIKKYPALHAVIHKATKRVDDLFPKIINVNVLMEFASVWMKAGFARLEIGHKLAASLALTDVPDDVEVQAPWPAWSLVVPDGLFGLDDGQKSPMARIWCLGTEPIYFVGGDGSLTGPITPELAKKYSIGESEETMKCIYSLIKGACLALDEPEEYKKETIGSRSSSSKKQKRDGLPDFGQSRFMLSAPVKVDVRQHLLDILSSGRRKGSGGSAPTVQFFVRGHWRNQAHGQGRQLRKRIRIEGFWKGPEESRILLRNYKVKEGKTEA